MPALLYSCTCSCIFYVCLSHTSVPGAIDRWIPAHTAVVQSGSAVSRSSWLLLLLLCWVVRLVPYVSSFNLPAIRYYTVAWRLSLPAIGVGPSRVNLDQYRTHTTQHYASPQTLCLLPSPCLSAGRLSLSVCTCLTSSPSGSLRRASSTCSHTHTRMHCLLSFPSPCLRGSSYPRVKIHSATSGRLVKIHPLRNWEKCGENAAASHSCRHWGVRTAFGNSETHKAWGSGSSAKRVV